jgi:hypothetical protein
VSSVESIWGPFVKCGCALRGFLWTSPNKTPESPSKSTPELLPNHLLTTSPDPLTNMDDSDEYSSEEEVEREVPRSMAARFRISNAVNPSKIKMYTVTQLYGKIYLRGQLSLLTCSVSRYAEKTERRRRS